MNRSGVVWTAVIVVAALELLLVRMARDAVLLAVALPVAVALAMLIWSMRQRVVREEPLTEYIDNGPAEMLGRWHARASMLTARADGTRADWDRHLRPLLAKEFELSTGLRVAKNRRATEAPGQQHYGPQNRRSESRGAGSATTAASTDGTYCTTVARCRAVASAR
ncbi:hypothetical protein [Nocardia neocaledoniensis]|uniref:hypothetical protein n=1 Tax=Nocardia neocaledoniensis TaxID=236511 RepID=UPI00245515DA|nr:hypothetical protein [Nocardia neocaledoniensis]